VKRDTACFCRVSDVSVTSDHPGNVLILPPPISSARLLKTSCGELSGKTDHKARLPLKREIASVFRSDEQSLRSRQYLRKVGRRPDEIDDPGKRGSSWGRKGAHFRTRYSRRAIRQRAFNSEQSSSGRRGIQECSGGGLGSRTRGARNVAAPLFEEHQERNAMSNRAFSLESEIRGARRLTVVASSWLALACGSACHVSLRPCVVRRRSMAICIYARYLPVESPRPRGGRTDDTPRVQILVSATPR